MSAKNYSFVCYVLRDLLPLDPSASRAQISLGTSGLIYKGSKVLCRNSRHSPTHRIRVSSGLLDVLISMQLKASYQINASQLNTSHATNAFHPSLVVLS